MHSPFGMSPEHLFIRRVIWQAPNEVSVQMVLSITVHYITFFTKQYLGMRLCFKMLFIIIVVVVVVVID
jgi:hypothetical protein